MIQLSSIEQEALGLLEWPRLCGQVASFASTGAGRRHCEQLPLGASLPESRCLLTETSELLALDGLIEAGLSFQGVADIQPTVQLCGKGGIVGGEALLEPVSYTHLTLPTKA